MQIKRITTAVILPVVLMLIWSAAALAAPASAKVEAARIAPATFPLAINGRTLHYSVNFEPVMPGQEVVFATAPHLTQRLAVQIDGQNLASREGQYFWRAPQNPGVHKVDFHLRSEAAVTGYQTISAQLLVMVPAKRISNGYLNGYRMGQYPPALKNLSSYKAPEGFIEVTVKNQNLRISPNFTLGQFLCKQKGNFPKYVALQPALLNKLEELLLEVNARGITTPSFVVMSGYRTPFYNRAIKNVPNSYHIYGGAADIYIDVDGDGVMDDINRDGVQDQADATLLYEWADSLVARHNRPDLVGGVGEYTSTAAHGPFIHIDVRGTPARWGHWPP